MSQHNRWGISAAVCLALICFAPLAALAQRDLANHRSYAVLDRFQQAITHVTLTADQKPAVAQIMANASSQADQFAATARGFTRAERAQALGDFGRSIRQQLSKVLTADQMATLDLYLGPGPSSRPTADDFEGPMLMRYLPRALKKLDLSSAQRQQADDLITSFGQKAAALRAQTANGSVVYSQMRQLRQDLKSQLASVLTPDQMQTLVQEMEEMRENESGAATRPQAQAGGNASGDETAEAGERPLPSVGTPAPDVKIAEASGHDFIPANYKGHVLVLEFGSMSCPEFRNQVQAMESLKAAEGPRAFFILVYTREAYPAGERDLPENKDQNISIPAAATLSERETQAQSAQQSLGISMMVGVDSMDDSVSSAFGTFPNGAVVIGKDGKIAAVQRWCSPDGLRRAIDEAYDGPVNSGN